LKPAIKNGRAFTLGDGQNVWDYVHVTDLADALIKLMEDVLKPHSGNTDWGMGGYYFYEDGEYTWGDLHKKIAEILYVDATIKSLDLGEMAAKDASKIHPWGPILWGGNARS
jgi:nucleoside-diphosphate-sugar epimerase